MSPIALLGIGLAVLMTANAILVGEVLGQREKIGQLDAQRSQAVSAATECSRSVEKMTSEAENQAVAASKAIAAAQGRARAAEARARGELTRVQAVPGDSCASAQVETREWLEKRRAVK